MRPSRTGIAVEPHVIKTSVKTYVERVPHKPLLPRTRYEVLLTYAAKRSIGSAAS
ncbi:MAG: hypothetical protein U1A78_27870 [Polyangia bacterium]